MLNRALARSEVDTIIKMGFFIRDLHRHIDELHKKQFASKNANEKFIVYRGQGMSKEDLEKISKTKGGLISFNNFLSTSKTETVALDFLKHALSIPDRIGVLFVIIVDPAQSTTPFASVAEVGYFKNEDEILFAMHTVFRIKRIERADENPRIFRVELELTDDNDKDLQVLTKTIREETYPDEAGWQRLAEVLVMKLGQPVKAEEIYRILMEQESKDNRKGYLYNRLGLCKLKQAEYVEAIRFYEKSIEAYEMYSPEDHLGTAWSYSNLGLVYSNMSGYEKAHSYYEKALAIRQQSLPFNHPDLASSYNNIGNVCYNTGEYLKAHSYYEKALTIRQRSLPSKHPDLGTSHNNIGLVYHDMGEYAKALLSHEKALAIRQQSLPSNHPDVAVSYNNIGLVYDDMGEYAKALLSHEKALAIRQQSLPSNHPDVAISFNNIGLVYENMKNYSKAYMYYETTVKTEEQSLLWNHSNLQDYRNNLDRVKNKL
ncbi:unnamed protein product [Didymodactylos carnosus]|uniref:ADP ribosyltransferase domain-containing protein n=1 Tax=Didymodactylos carnosus TaxID=1234261 RepID=A0A815DL82_9BILA|nr:unnamed protein product [Didymodactylos carnosus]CAF4115918.1 unnamed protein product [Didymodactylos carnosus]